MSSIQVGVDLRTHLQSLAEEQGCSLTDQALAHALESRANFGACSEGEGRFFLPETASGRSIYFVGNSLGPQPRAVKQTVEKALGKWAREGVAGWFRGQDKWAALDSSLNQDMAALVGALPSEVVVMNALSVNLHLMLAAFYRPLPGRQLIIVEHGAFPSDMHVLESHVRSRGLDPQDVILHVEKRPGERIWRMEDIVQCIKQHGHGTALVMFSGVHYATGQLFDMAEITRVAHECGALVGFDLAHAVGNVELELHEWGVDFAVWCCYKYLCGGPGAVGACFVHEKHGNDPFVPRLAGWWGQRIEDRFSFAQPSFVPTPGAMGFQLSTPSPLAMAPLRAALDIFKEAGGMRQIRRNSVLLTGYLEILLQELGTDIQVITPSDPQQRGCQLSLTFQGRSAEEVLAQMEVHGVMCDVRKPNVIRVAPMPLYNSFSDVYAFVQILKSVLKEE